MGTETSKNKLNHQSPQLEESTSELIKVTDITKKCVSYSLENDTPQSEILTEYCESQNSFTRIYLLRHLPYKECPKYSLYEDIRDKLKEKLTNNEIHKSLEEKYGDFYNDLIKNFEQEKNPIKSLFSMLDDSLCTDSSKLDPNLYDSIFQDQKNTIFIHNPIDSSKERIKQSVNYIKTSYPDINSQEENIVGSQKGIDKQLAVIKAGEELVKIIVDIKSEIKQENSKLKGKNIVILGSRSHSHFLNVKKFDANGKDESEGEFKQKGYDFIDLDDNLDIIDDTSKIVITPGNYKELKLIFPEINDGSITDFQDKIDAHFMENPQLFEEYLLSKNPDLRFVCIANLIKNGKFDVVLENITELFNLEKEENIILFGNNLLGLCNKNQKKEIFKSLEGKISIITKLNLENLENLEYLVNYNEFVKDNINYLREKTQDENIKNGKKVNMSVGFNEEQYNAIENLLTSDDILLIEATAGSGKSIKLLEILEYLSPKEDTSENKYFPIYVHLGKSKKINDIKKEIETQKTGLYGTGKYKFVYLFDAIDEAGMNDDDKKEFLKITEELQKKGKVIITSRHGHLVNTDMKKIELKALTTEQTDEYIQEYIAGNQEWKNIWIKWDKNGFIKEIKDNPLMLSMLVELIKNTDKIKKLKKYGIIESLDIEKKSDLFDIIVTLRLYEGEIKKIDEGKNIDNIDIENIKEIINKRKKILELIALESVNKSGFLSKEEIKDIITKKNLGGGMNLGRTEKIENLNLIFKYNSETEQYQFVHEKFKEYFFYVNLKKKTEEYWEKYIGEKNNWGRIYSILSYMTFNSFEEGLPLLEKIVDSLWFINNEPVVKYIYSVIGKINSEEGLPLLEKIITLPRFVYNEYVIKDICLTIGKINSEKGLPLLEKIITLPRFICDEISGIEACLTIGKINSTKGLPILEKIVDLPGFTYNKYIIKYVCWAIAEINSKEGLSLLEKIITLPRFAKDEDVIEYVCWVIAKINSKEGLSLIKKIILLPRFTNNKDSVGHICWAIKEINSKDGLSLLEQIISLPGFINNKDAIQDTILSIAKINSKDGLSLLEQIISLPGFINNKDATEYTYGAIEKIGSQKGVQISKRLQKFKNKYNQN